MKTGEIVIVNNWGDEHEAVVIGVNPENGYIAARDGRGVLFEHLSPFVEGSARYFKPKVSDVVGYTAEELANQAAAADEIIINHEGPGAGEPLVPDTRAVPVVTPTPVRKGRRLI